MLELPEGWESDYDGQRWFYRYRPNGLTQFQFPQPGDEFPNFVGDNIELEPEERLASELQRRGRNSQGGNSRDEFERSRCGREKIGASPGENEFGMGATGYFDPSSFMYFGPDEDEDEASVVNEHGDEQNAILSNGKEELPVSATDSVRRSESTPSTLRSELATSPLVIVDVSAALDNQLVELPDDKEQKGSPLSSVPELAGSHTAKCADELAPVELDAASSVTSPAGAALLHSNMAELSADNYPVKRKTPPPPPPAPLEPVDSYPLVSASFSFPPLRNSGDSNNSTGTTVGDTKVQRKLNVPRERPSSISEGQAKFHPFIPEQRMSRDTMRDPQRSSMILSGTTVLQSQNSELSHMKPAASDISTPGPENWLGRPKMFEPPVDPKRVSVPGPLQAPQKIQLDASSNHIPGSRLPPLPGSGARHHSTSSYPGQILEDDSNPGSSHAPSMSKPAYRRSIVPLHQVQQPYILAGGPSRSADLPIAYASRGDSAPFYLVGSKMAATGYFPIPHPLPVVAPVVPLRPRKSPSPEHVASTGPPRPPPPRSSHSMPDTLDEIADAISELSSIMPTPPSSHNTQAQTSQPPWVSPVHNPGLNQQQQLSELAGSQPVSGLSSGSCIIEGLQGARYPAPSPPIDQRSSVIMGATTPHVSNEESNQGQTYPSPLSVSSLPVHRQSSNVSLQSSSPRPSPNTLVSPRSSGQAGFSSHPGAAKGPLEGCGLHQSLAELPSNAFDPLPSPEIQVSSLHRGSSTASSQPQTGGRVQLQSTDDMPHPSPVSSQSFIHELPANSARPSQSPVAEAVPAKHKPFPMLPGQVTPMPSQIGSAPVFIQPVKDEPAKPNSTQQSPSTASSPQQPVYSHPLTQRESRPASLGVPTGTGQGQQQHSRPLSQLQMKPNQPNVAQGFATLMNIQTRPTLKSHQRPHSFHSGAAAPRPLASTLQSTAPYSAPGLRSNGAAAATEAGRGVKKWAKKIFQSSSAKQNAIVTEVLIVPPPRPDPTSAMADNSAPVKSSADQAHQQPVSQANAHFPPSQSQNRDSSHSLVTPETIPESHGSSQTPLEQSDTRQNAQTNQSNMTSPRRMTTQVQLTASASDTVGCTTPSTSVTTAATPSHQHQTLPPTARGSSNTTISTHPPYYSPPQTPSPPKTTEASRSKVGASNMNSYLSIANGATSIVTPGSSSGAGPVPVSKSWVSKAIDYSGGDWGDGWS